MNNEVRGRIPPPPQQEYRYSYASGLFDHTKRIRHNMLVSIVPEILQYEPIFRSPFWEEASWRNPYGSLGSPGILAPLFFE